MSPTVSAAIFPRSRASRAAAGTARAFTLVEVLLVLALLALVIAVLLPATGSLFRGARGESAEDTLARVMQEARREAVLTGREVILRFDREAGRLRWTGGETPRAVEPGTIIEFLRPRDGPTVLVGGRLLETETVNVVTLHPDGTCDPVRIQFRRSGMEPRVVRIDPWTCAPGLETKS